MATEKTWQQWLPRLYNLRRDKCGSHQRPHKPVLLLSILDLLDRGHLTRNEIPLDDTLIVARRHSKVRSNTDSSPKNDHH